MGAERCGLSRAATTGAGLLHRILMSMGGFMSVYVQGETPGALVLNFCRDVRLRSNFLVQRGAFMGHFNSPKWCFIAIFVPQSGALFQKVTPM